MREKNAKVNKSDDNILENLNCILKKNNWFSAAFCINFYKSDSSVEFKEGLNKIRTLLNIASKSDDTKSVLEAVSKLICEKLSSDAIKTASLQTKTNNDQVILLFIWLFIFIQNSIIRYCTFLN